MQIRRLIGFLVPIIGMVVSASWRAASQDDPFIALETNAKGVHTYVRRGEIRAITDVSLTLRSGMFVYAKESCNEVRKAMPRE